MAAGVTCAFALKKKAASCPFSLSLFPAAAQRHRFPPLPTLPQRRENGPFVLCGLVVLRVSRCLAASFLASFIASLPE